MTRDDIISMARKAGKADGTTPLERSIVLYAAKSSLFLEKFAELVAAAEREACAKACEAEAENLIGMAYESIALGCAESIRARGNE